MYILYTKPTCAFSEAVEEYALFHGIQYDKRDISTSDEYKKELVVQGGKERTPYLLDTDTGLGMYESPAIIAYLEERRGDNLNDNGSAISQSTCSPEFEEGDSHR